MLGAGRIMRRSGRQRISTIVSLPLSLSLSLSRSGPRSRSGPGVGLRLAAKITSTASGKVQILAGTVRAVPVVVLHSERPAASTGDVAVTRRHRFLVSKIGFQFFKAFELVETLK